MNRFGQYEAVRMARTRGDLFARIYEGFAHVRIATIVSRMIDIEIAMMATRRYFPHTFGYPYRQLRQFPQRFLRDMILIYLNKTMRERWYQSGGRISPLELQQEAETRIRNVFVNVFQIHFKFFNCPKPPYVVDSNEELWLRVALIHFINSIYEGTLQKVWADARQGILW